MLEKVSDTKLSSLINNIKETSANVAKKVWNLFMKLLGMMNRVFVTIQTWFSKKFKKDKIIKASNLLSKAITYNESTDNVFTEEKENTKNKVLQAFIKSYINASKSFTTKFKNSPGSLKNIFNDMKITLGDTSTNVNLKDFFNLEESSKSEQDVINYAKLFISILKSDICKLTFEIDNPDFKILSIEKYLSIVEKRNR